MWSAVPVQATYVSRLSRSVRNIDSGLNYHILEVLNSYIFSRSITYIQEFDCEADSSATQPSTVQFLVIIELFLAKGGRWKSFVG